MKRCIEFSAHRTAGTLLMVLAVTMFPVTGTYAQVYQSITGKLLERKTRQAVPYATVALIRASDSSMINGAMSDENGVFTISPVITGTYRLRVSSIGYKTENRNITVMNGTTDAGNIDLQETTTVLKEVEVVGEQVKARSESDRTTFYMTKKMLDASNTGMDILKLIPGIQVDFMQNISLEGSRNIQVFVDGRERDGSFVSQLNPKQIERVEIISKPGANNDGNTTGAINIILKKERSSGISGQIYAEIPASLSEIYIRPDYSLNWGFKKLNLYTAYKGEMTYLDLQESTTRKVWNGSVTNEITSNQDVRQKDWSHRFNFGIDYFISTHDQLNFYSLYNPWSRELDGDADLRLSGSINKLWQARKEDSDMNTATFSSLYYRHLFKREGRELSAEISDYRMKGKNSTTYLPEGNEISIPVRANTAEPLQNVTSIKIDFTSRLWKKLDLSTGVKTKYDVLQDSYLQDFHYDKKILAAYGTLSYKHTKCFVSVGLRAEETVTSLKSSFRHSGLSLFPNASFNYKLTSIQNIQLCYNRSIRRPGIYQLNPHTAIDDPFTVSKGNPFLTPELRNSLFLEYSIRFKTSYLATRLFYNKFTNVINNLTFINDTGAFETQAQNMGTLHQYGLQFSGTFRMGILTLNPFLQVYECSTSGNSLAKQHGVENRQNLAYNSALSAILSFRHDIDFTFVMQSASPKNDIQGNSFSGVLYFVSLKKTFKQKLTIGIVSALPFTKSFTYQGSDLAGSDFTSHYEGNVKISSPFCWLKLSYQFSTGKKKETVHPESEEIDNRPKKGF